MAQRVSIGGEIDEDTGDLVGNEFFDSYVTIEMADLYLLGDIEFNQLWAGQTNDAKARALVSATRWLDQQQWQGQRTSPDQPLQFPRTGLTDCNGVAVSSSASPPAEIKNATYVLAAQLISNNTLQNASTQGGQNIKRLEAGSVEIEYFRPSDGAVFPPRVIREVRCFLSSSSSATIAGAFSSGTGVSSATPKTRDYGREEGFA